MDSDKSRFFSLVLGDIQGGVAAALMSLPSTILFGIIAFAPLGHGATVPGIIASIHCAIFLGFFSAILGSSPVMISGPRPTVALILGTLCTQLLSASHGIIPGIANSTETIMACAFLSIALAGALQFLLGLFRLGGMIKFIPYPVIAGFMNATAVLMIFSQLTTLCGITDQHSIAEYKPWPLFIGLSTMGFMVVAVKISAKLPTTIVGLLLGTLLHHGLSAWGVSSEALGPLLGVIPAEFPRSDQLLAWQALPLMMPESNGWHLLLSAALSMALLGSIDSLLTTVSIDDVTNNRTDSNRELIGQGIGNMISACFGGMMGAGKVAVSLVNIRDGGKTSLSGSVCALVYLIIIVYCAPAVGQIPRTVLAAGMIMTGFGLIDRWSLQWIKNSLIARDKAVKEASVRNFLTMIMVVVVTIATDLTVAVGAGTAVALLFFIQQTSRSVIRRVYRGNTIRAKVDRSEDAQRVLADKGQRIAVMELEGALFFASTDRVAMEIDALTATETHYVILDMRRLKYIDSTGSRVLITACHRLQRQGNEMLFCGLRSSRRLWHQLETEGFFQVIKEQRVFSDVDTALAWCEDRILAEFIENWGQDRELPLAEFSLLEGLAPESLRLLQSFLTRECFTSGTILFKQGDPGDAMFLLAKGSVALVMQLPDGGSKQLGILTPGTLFGEMSLLDNENRSASVLALSDAVCFRLEASDFLHIIHQTPGLAAVFLGNMSRLFAKRLRRANTVIAELES